MRAEDERKIVLGAFLTVTFNLIIACIGFITFALYYTSGNSIRPGRVDVNIIGFTGMFIGVFQSLYLFPIMFFAFRYRRWNLFKGVALGGAITALLNIIFWVFFSKG
jgi:hypothetical protein